RQVRPENRSLAETELLDKQGKADGNLFASRPSGDMDRIATEFGDRIGSLLRQSCASEVNGEQQQDQSRGEVGCAIFPGHDKPPGSTMANSLLNPQQPE